MSSDILNRRTEVLYAPNVKRFKNYANRLDVTNQKEFEPDARLENQLIKSGTGDSLKRREEEIFETELVSYRLLNESGFFTIPDVKKLKSCEDVELCKSEIVYRDGTCVNQSNIAYNDDFVNRPDENDPNRANSLHRGDSNNNWNNLNRRAAQSKVFGSQLNSVAFTVRDEIRKQSSSLRTEDDRKNIEFIVMDGCSKRNESTSPIMCNNLDNELTSSDINSLIESLPRLKVTKPNQLHSESSGAFMEYNRSSVIVPRAGALTLESLVTGDSADDSVFSQLRSQPLVHHSVVRNQPHHPWAQMCEEESSLDGSELFESSFCSIDSAVTERSFESLPKVFYDPSIHRGPVLQVPGDLGARDGGRNGGVKLVMPLTRPVPSILAAKCSEKVGQAEGGRMESCGEGLMTENIDKPQNNEKNIMGDVLVRPALRSVAEGANVGVCQDGASEGKVNSLQKQLESVLTSQNGLAGSRCDARLKAMGRVPSSKTMTRLTFTSPAKSRSVASTRPTFLSPKNLRRGLRHNSGASERDVVSEFIRHLRNRKSQPKPSSSSASFTSLARLASSLTSSLNSSSVYSLHDTVSSAQALSRNNLLDARENGTKGGKMREGWTRGGGSQSANVKGDAGNCVSLHGNTVATDNIFSNSSAFSTAVRDLKLNRNTDDLGNKEIKMSSATAVTSSAVQPCTVRPPFCLQGKPPRPCKISHGDGDVEMLLETQSADQSNKGCAAVSNMNFAVSSKRSCSSDKVVNTKSAINDCKYNNSHQYCREEGSGSARYQIDNVKGSDVQASSVTGTLSSGDASRAFACGATGRQFHTHSRSELESVRADSLSHVRSQSSSGRSDRGMKGGARNHRRGEERAKGRELTGLAEGLRVGGANVVQQKRSRSAARLSLIGAQQQQQNTAVSTAVPAPSRKGKAPAPKPSALFSASISSPAPSKDLQVLGGPSTPPPLKKSYYQPGRGGFK